MSAAACSDQRTQLSEQGFCVVPDVLSKSDTLAVREALLEAAAGFRSAGGQTFMPELDPNDRNIRVFNLLEHHERFRELILHALAVPFVELLLGPHWMISNFTANIARPGSQSMHLHSDQALVVPAPWASPWSMNVIWCLDDVYEANGATRYVPGSHQWRDVSQVPADALQRTQPFDAPAGAIIVMDGRLWHTSGINRTEAAERALLFAYYSVDFLRPQVNWNALLSPATQQQLSEPLAQRLGLGPVGNVRRGAEVLNAMPGQPPLQ